MFLEPRSETGTGRRRGRDRRSGYVSVSVCVVLMGRQQSIRGGGEPVGEVWINKLVGKRINQ